MRTKSFRVATIQSTPPNEGAPMTTNSMTGSTLTGSNPISTAAGRAHQMVDDVAQKAAPAMQTATARAHETIDKVASAGSSAADWATESGTQLANKSGALAEACTGYVRARPLMSVAGALALGYFAGRVLR